MKKTLSLMLALIMSLSAFVTAFATQAEPNEVIKIDSIEALSEVRNNLDGKYILTKDLDLSDIADWQAIGTQDAPFTGEFDGDGYSIVGMNTTTSLFGEIKAADIKNLGIVDCNLYYNANDVATSECAGAFAAHAYDSAFENCFVSGSIKGFIDAGLVSVATYGSMGGITGLSQNTSFTNCYNTANIHLDFYKVTSAELGGITGDAVDCTFVTCYNAGALTAACTDEYNPHGDRNVSYGGLVGQTNEAIKFDSCYFINSKENAIGKTAETPEGACALTDAQMKTQATFAGFDFANTWEILDASYPTLKIYNKVQVEIPEKDPVVGLPEEPEESEQPEQPAVLPDISIDILYKQTAPVFSDDRIEIAAWESADESIAVINDEGLVEGTGAGSTTIKITTADGETATVNVNVEYSIVQKIIYAFFGWIFGLIK